MPYIGDIYMVQAMVQLSEHANRVINIVKAKYDLRDKSEAIERIMMEYEVEFIEPELKPEFIQSLIEVRTKGKFRRIRNVSDILKK